MKLTPLRYDPLDESITLQIDYEAREALAKSATMVEAAYSDREVRALIACRGRDFLPRFATGIETLSQLARLESGQMETGVEELQNALDVTLFAANYQVGSGAGVSTLPQTILLLAKVTPCPLPFLDLPPVVEVFDREKISPTAWNGFESLRLWKHSGPPHLFLFDMYQLGLAFQAAPSTNEHLRRLAHCIDVCTSLFRYTLATLASNEIASNKTKPPGRKRRKE